MRRAGCLGVLAWLASGALAAAQAPARRPGVPVLIYHQFVTDATPPGETVIPLARFAEQMRYLHEQGYQALSLAALEAHIRGERPAPPRSVVITIDDGWRSGLDAVPILEAYGLRASFWIIAGLTGGEGPYLDWAQVQALDRHPLFEVESHTLTHPWDPRDNLVTWTEGRGPKHGTQQARAELVDSRALLERHLGRAIRWLAWPCGWYNDRLIALAREAGYTALLTVDQGHVEPGDEITRIKRLFVDGACGMPAFIRTLEAGEYVVCATMGRPSLGRVPDA